MNDSDFLGYCVIHAGTELALFVGRDVIRLCNLAGMEVPKGVELDGWYAFHDAGEIAKIARQKLKEAENG